jgi:phospholipase D1/2
MSYPNVVGEDGTLSPLPDCEDVPDLGGKLLGTQSKTLPAILTS